MTIDTQFLSRCIQALETAFNQLKATPQSDIQYDIYRSAIIKEFEIVLEQSGKLLNKRLRPYFHSHQTADRLPFKAIFRQAGKCGLLERDAVDRWLRYRDHRNTTAQDYGSGLAEDTLPLIPHFITDAKAVVEIINSEDVT